MVSWVLTNTPEGDASGGGALLGSVKEKRRNRRNAGKRVVVHCEKLPPKRPTCCRFVGTTNNEQLKIRFNCETKGAMN